MIDTLPAANIGAHYADLSGDLMDMGGFDFLLVYFEYGLAHAIYTETSGMMGMGEIGVFSTSVQRLLAETTYYFRAVANDGTFLYYGGEEIFTTLKPIVVPVSSLPMIGSISVPLVRQPNVM